MLGVDPNAETCPEFEGIPNEDFDDSMSGAARDWVGAEEVGGALPVMARFGYMVPWRIESVYTNHHEARTPSLFNTMRAGSGVGDSSISSFGIGLRTLSLLDRSSAKPIGEVSLNSAVRGN